MTRPRRFELPSFDEISQRSGATGPAGRPNPYFDNPVVNRQSNQFARTFTGPARRDSAPTVAPVPSAVHEITGRHAGAYIPENPEGRHAASGRRINWAAAQETQGRHMGERTIEGRGDAAKDYIGRHTSDNRPGRHRADTRLDRARKAVGAWMKAS